MSSKRVWLFVCLLAFAKNAAAQQVVIDLATQAPDKVSERPAQPGGEVTVVLHSRIPRQKYTILVELTTIDIPELTSPLGRAAGSVLSCAEVGQQADDLFDADDETKLGESVDKIRTQLDSGVCSDPVVRRDIQAKVAKTVLSVDGAYRVPAGAALTITVSRSRKDVERKWVTRVSAGPRGRWLTSFGFGLVPSYDQTFFTAANGAGKFVIKQQREEHNLKLLPAAFFTWLPRSAELDNFSYGLTAGLGVKNDVPAVFGGFAVTYNWNLAFIAGVGVARESRLIGKYTVGDEVGENLNEEQLHQQVFRPRAFVAVTYRFGSNPWASDGAAATGEKKGAATDSGDSTDKKADTADAKKKDGEKKKPEPNQR